MMQRIIFLDIDGPMIPLRSYVANRHASYDQDLCPAAIRVLRETLMKSGAQIVFNTTHNRMAQKSDLWPGLINVFAAAGFVVGREVHDDSHTLYPSLDRLTAISEWLHRNGPADWVAFDDAPIADERAILTSAEHGIGMAEFNHAAKAFGFNPMTVLM